MFAILFATASAGFQHVKAKEGLKVTHKKYYDMAKAFENVMKKDRAVNTCDRDILIIECADGFDLVDDVPNSYCQFIEEQPVDLICPGVIIGEECYEPTHEIVCPSGSYMGEHKKHGKVKNDIQCNRSEFAPVEEVCPDGYEIIHEKKRDRCNKVTEECELVCPEGTVEGTFEGSDLLVCFEEFPLLPRCPDGYELSDDLEFCVREVERPCDKKDIFHEKSKSKSGLRHLKAISEKTDIKFKGAKEPKFKVMKDKDDKMTHHVVKKDYVVTRLIEQGLCTYQEIVPAIVDIEKIEVDRAEKCFDVNEVEPIALACPDGFELQQSKFSKAPACIATEIVPPVCPDGTILFEDMCYSPLDLRPVCPVGFRLNAAKDLCEKVDIQPPEYEWIEVRRCVGYDCQAYYDVACQVKEVHH